MKLYNLQGKVEKQIKLPKQFSEELRLDLIKKAVLAIQANKRQRYGASSEAGMRHSTKISRRRKNYKTGYGRSLARMPRKTVLRRGTQFIWVGAQAPGTVGGRIAHPPKSEKIWEQKMNKKERRMAIRSALTATLQKELLEKRGYKAESLVVVNDFENLDKTKDVIKVLNDLKLDKDVERSFIKRMRSGIGKLRGRRYRRVKGPLIVVGGDCKLVKSAKNLQGFDICAVNSLNAELLAPGCVPGRLTIWSEKALEKIEKEKLFI